MRPSTGAARLAEVLYHHPWAALDFAAALAGAPPSSACRWARGAFERLDVPSATPHKAWRRVLYPTLSLQKALGRPYRSPRLLERALLMNYARLPAARSYMKQVALGGRLAWSISPWEPCANPAVIFDGLMAVRSEAGCYLAGLVVPGANANLDWYTALMAVWRRWQRHMPFPAALFVVNFGLAGGELKMLAESLRRSDGDYLERVLVSDGRSALGDLERGAAAVRATVPVPAALPAARYFMRDCRAREPHPAETFLYWARGASPRAYWFATAPKSALLTLAAVARWPGMSRRQYAAILENRVRHPWKVLAGLRASGMIEEDGGMCAVAPRGLGLLAGVNGISEKLMGRMYKDQTALASYTLIRRHTEAVGDFVLPLIRSGELTAWEVARASYRFKLGQRERLEIRPDGAGAVRTRDGRTIFFWLEVDRGTRRGARLGRQIRRYIRALGASASEAPMPVILFLVATGNGEDEARLRRIARELEKQARTSIRSHGLRALLTTGDLMSRYARSERGLRESPVQWKIWRRFSNASYDPLLVSLAEAA
jgi:hypothetical protein